MSRRRRAAKRELSPDPRFESVLVTRLVNLVMEYFLFTILLKVSIEGIEVTKFIGIFSSEARAIAISRAL